MFSCGVRNYSYKKKRNAEYTEFSQRSTEEKTNSFYFLCVLCVPSAASAFRFSFSSPLVLS